MSVLDALAAGLGVSRREAQAVLEAALPPSPEADEQEEDLG